VYRNPIYLAKEYKEMIDSGKAKNQAELARIKSISRARVTQILNLLKLDKNIIDKFEQIGDPMHERIFSERKLRDLNKQKANLHS
jgi:ParB-like chromosome segregation protein Spo0J